MVKVKNKGELKWCLEKHAVGKVPVKWATNHLKITPQKFKQLYAKYKTTNNTTPITGQNLGRPKKPITKKTIQIIKQTYKKYQLNSKYLQKIIHKHQKITISHRTIHELYTQLEIRTPPPNKQKHKSPLDPI